MPFANNKVAPTDGGQEEPDEENGRSRMSAEFPGKEKKVLVVVEPRESQTSEDGRQVVPFVGPLPTQASVSHRHLRRDSSSQGNVTDAMERVKSVTSLKKASQAKMAGQRGGLQGTSLQNGSIASAFRAPHPKPGYGLCFSPKGDLLLRYGFGPEIKVMKAVNGSLVNNLKGSPGQIRFAAFSLDGKYIMAASDDCHIFIYNADSASSGMSTLKANVDVGMEPVKYCLLSPDAGTILSCDDDGQLETWSVEEERLLVRYETGHSSVMASFSSDGKKIISCADFECGLALMDAESAEVLISEAFDRLLEGRNQQGYAIAPNGRWVVVYVKEQTWNANLAVYDVQDQSYKTCMACDGAVLDVEFSCDGYEFIAAGRDNMIHVYDAETMELISTLNGHDCDVMCVHASSGRQYAISGDSDGQVFVWDVNHSTPLLRLQAHKAPIAECDISVDGSRAFTLDIEGNAHLWYLEMQGVFDIMREQSEHLSCCELTADGHRMAVGYTDGTLRMWNVGVSVSSIWSHKHHSSPVECLVLNADKGIVASGSRDGTVLLTGIGGGQVLVEMHAHDDVVTGLAYSADGAKLLSCARDGSLCLWDERDMQAAARRTLSVSLSFSRVEDNVSAGVKPSRRWQDPSDGLPGIMCCCLSPKGNLAAAACLSGCVAVWSTLSGALSHAVVVSDVPVTSLSFSDDGRHLMAGSADGSASVLDPDGGKVFRKLAGGNASSITSVYFEHGGGHGKDLADISAVSVCGRQAVTWELAGSSVAHVADFIADHHGLFLKNSMDKHEFVAHTGLALYDPLVKAAMYDMRPCEVHPGNSSLFRESTTTLMGGVHHERMVLYTPPDRTVAMLSNEAGGVRCIDFSPNGKLLVSGNLRGELCIWDMVHNQQIKSWMAHKRSAITAVKFSHDSTMVYSCGEDAKVILWHWRTCAQAGVLAAHQSPVSCVDMSLNGKIIVSGDTDGILVVWDAITHDAMHVLPLHEGAVLSVSVLPDGSRIISSGQDEHIAIIDSENGHEVSCLDDALDGKGLTAKFSFDGTRAEIGNEKGDILIWNMDKECLMYDIKAHIGSVFDCAWSGDSRRLLSVGKDGNARLWDAAAGSELCQANFERGFGTIESGGFIRCDLSADGSTMAGCTAKGHLFSWDVGRELRQAPNGQMLYQWLASMPVVRAKQVYSGLLSHFPLLFNMQDSRGWTVLMHAASQSNPEIVKIIVDTIPPKFRALGLMASPLQRLADCDDGHDHPVPMSTSGRTGGLSSRALVMSEEPSAIRIAIDASSGDCVHHLLNAVLDEKVTPGSYHSVTRALNDVAQQYPSMCDAFLCGLPLKVLGEMEVPSRIAAEGMVVHAATSYTSYKELWEERLNLDKEEKGPLVVMEAVMVQLPFCSEIGGDSLLHVLGESNVPVRTFGSETVNAIITFKWRKFARRSINVKTIIFMVYLLTYIVYSIFISDDRGPLVVTYNEVDPLDPTNPLPTVNSTSGVDFVGLVSYGEGRACVALSFVVFAFGAYFMGLEGVQLLKLGWADYFSSFWNFMDLSAYTISMIIPPCVLLRYQMQDGGFVYPLAAVEALLLSAKSLFFAQAVDGLGTFVYMIIEIIKGLKYFYVLLLMLYISFGAALVNLLRIPPSGDPSFVIFPGYDSFPNSLQSLFLSQLQNQDSRGMMGTMWAPFTIIICCLYALLANVILINLIITLMNDLYTKIKTEQELVFLKNRAELILEVESTMSIQDVTKYKDTPPYLHLLRPVNLEGKRDEARAGNLAGLDDEGPPQLPAAEFTEAAGPNKPDGDSGPSRDPSGRSDATSSATTTKGSKSVISRAGSQVKRGGPARHRTSLMQSSFSQRGDAGFGGAPGMQALLVDMYAAMEKQNRELLVLRRNVEMMAKGQGLNPLTASGNDADLATSPHLAPAPAAATTSRVPGLSGQQQQQQQPGPSSRLTGSTATRKPPPGGLLVTIPELPSRRNPAALTASPNDDSDHSLTSALLEELDRLHSPIGQTAPGPSQPPSQMHRPMTSPMAPHAHTDEEQRRASASGRPSPSQLHGLDEHGKGHVAWNLEE